MMEDDFDIDDDYDEEYDNVLSEVLKRYEYYISHNEVAYFDVDDLELIIEYFFLTSKIDEACQAVNYALKIHPNNKDLKLKKARIFLSAKRYQEAVILIDSSNLDNPKQFAIKAECLLNLGKLNEAKNAFTQYLNSGNEDEIPSLCRKIANTCNSCFQSSMALHFVELGLQYNPDDADLIIEQANTLEELGRIKEAIDIYDRLLDVNPYDHRCWFLLGSLYFNISKYNKALDAYDFASAINENDIAPIIQKGHCYFNMGEYKKAIEMYSVYTENIGTDSSIWTYLGECYENLEMYKEAYDCFVKSNEIEPQNFDSLIGMALCLIQTRQNEEATQLLDLAEELRPNDAEIEAYRGDIKINMAESTNDETLLKEGLNYYLHSYELDSTQIHLLVDIGNVYLRLEDYESAKKYYELANNNNDDTENLFFLLAIAYYNLKDYDKMKHYLELAEENDDNAKNNFINIYPEAIKYL